MAPGTEHPPQPAVAALQQEEEQEEEEQRIDRLFRRQDPRQPEARAGSELQRFLRAYRTETVRTETGQ